MLEWRAIGLLSGDADCVQDFLGLIVWFWQWIAFHGLEFSEHLGEPLEVCRISGVEGFQHPAGHGFLAITETKHLVMGRLVIYRHTPRPLVTHPHFLSKIPPVVYRAIRSLLFREIQRRALPLAWANEGTVRVSRAK